MVLRFASNLRDIRAQRRQYWETIADNLSKAGWSWRLRLSD
jgi:hypothetical protein